MAHRVLRNAQLRFYTVQLKRISVVPYLSDIVWIKERRLVGR